MTRRCSGHAARSSWPKPPATSGRWPRPTTCWASWPAGTSTPHGIT
jgi:hypothetical protein